MGYIDVICSDPFFLRILILELFIYLLVFNHRQIGMSSVEQKFLHFAQSLKNVYLRKFELRKNAHIFDGNVYYSYSERISSLNTWYTTKLCPQSLVDEVIAEMVDLIRDVSDYSGRKMIAAEGRDVSLSVYLKNFIRYHKKDGSCFVVVFVRLVGAILYQVKEVLYIKHDPQIISKIDYYITFSEHELRRLMKDRRNLLTAEQILFLCQSLLIMQNLKEIEMENPHEDWVLPGIVKMAKKNSQAW